MIETLSRFKLAAATAVVVAAICRDGLADPPVLDQQHIPNGYIYSTFVGSTQNSGQTFTVGLSGTLTNLDVKIHRSNTPTLPLVVELRATNGFGAPNMNPIGLLASTSLEYSQVSNSTAYTHIDLGSQAFAVQPGQLLAIVAKSSAPENSSYLWGTSQSPGTDYLGGQAFTKHISQSTFVALPGDDRGFRTYVVPEPGAWQLLLAVCIALQIHRGAVRARPL